MRLVSGAAAMAIATQIAILLAILQLIAIPIATQAALNAHYLSGECGRNLVCLLTNTPDLLHIS